MRVAGLREREPERARARCASQRAPILFAAVVVVVVVEVAAAVWTKKRSFAGLALAS